MMLGESQNVAIVNKEECKKFLKWMCAPSDKKSPAHSAFEQMMTTGEKDPLAVFLSGLKVTCGDLDKVRENPLLRLQANPTRVFESGILVGYYLALSSGSPEFSEVLAPLFEKVENVTPISAAKGFNRD